MGAESSGRVPTIGGVSLKHISLLTLTFQNSALILIMHYSRIMPPVDGKRYFTSTAVFLNEVIKLAVSLTVALYDISKSLAPGTPASTLLKTLVSEVFTGDSWKLAIPALLYTVQNSLQYVAVSNLDAATFQVTYQLKILTTALFSVTMLGRQLSAKKWISLILLMSGVAIVQIPTVGDKTSMSDLKGQADRYAFPKSIEELAALGSTAAAQLMKKSASYQGIEKDAETQHPHLNASLGLMAVIIACAISGLAGVYFEKVLKQSSTQTSLWVRNVQLAFYSLFPAFFLGVVFKDGPEIARNGFFSGYNAIVWLAIIFQAFGGIVVALVVNYADNIAKNFATSLSIVISFIASVWLFNLSITTNYLLGTAIVLYATYMYSAPDQPKPTPAKIVPFEQTAVDGEPHYYDNDSPSKATVPLMSEAKTTSSNPSTPIGDGPHHFRSGSERRIFMKRGD